MNKPITILAEEFKNKQVNLINNSKLPFFIVESILKDCLREVQIASQKQLEMDKIKYDKELLEAQLDAKNNSDEDGE